jgi:osmoprotectant transport system permease protein
VVDRPFIDWAWIADHLDDVVEKLGQHLTLLFLPMIAGFAISLVLAILALRRPGTVGPVTVVTGLLYTIPSLAAFAVLRPIFGLSLWTAVIPLATYTLLILYRNIVAGFRSVPPEIHEAALGMGYTPRSRLLRVELPLAVPLIMAGVRLAAVTTIGLVTVASVIGADKFGGFGQFITEGLQTNFSTKIYLGAVLSVVLAFVVDGSLVLLERHMTPWARVRAARG